MVTDTGDRTTLTLSVADRLNFLTKLVIFQDLAQTEFIEQLATHLEEVQFPADHTIFAQGDRGDLLYILFSGRVKVHFDDVQLAELTPGSYFGEMAIFESRPRSASVTTLEPCQCLVLTQEQVYQAIKERPKVAIQMINVLCQRVRKLNRLFGASEDLFYNQVQQQVLS
ncbi:MAG: cyclic nucleotide-binding domain-containing protein [Roseofilum sp. SBFL]|uniref:cyclic nucleotide-binding domain-containing protein n=1 Tax=unclassified Roseofilum TaxID=2620099 RepID=UPI001B07D1DB|nr:MULTISPECIES: cyclic nucleotide-binding domain-containing protein [unclassified Roseofilum]MBP0013861.1 cyclic nucleotide-binding domain-containing protein [Roseofilum sp. SID3]MBP0026316.1 cyclic nucleotide-binding domain-containing protein [Roseofilum sp. SID2]MBP0040015.1 cyclic nucleotide-binding domain-containing protein [Roseofilum sp. SID1]MBP0041954.1 cyclic nucleotide-binding domain-containing protein [Roseofilum sp. SBFL]